METPGTISDGQMLRLPSVTMKLLVVLLSVVAVTSFQTSVPFHTPGKLLISPLRSKALPPQGNSIRQSLSLPRTKDTSIYPLSLSIHETWVSRFRLSVAASPQSDVATDSMPELGKDGVYHCLDAEQHQNLLKAFPDKLIVMKVFAPWCRACKGLEPKFNAIVRDKKYAKLPIVWADLTIQHNKDYIKKIGVLALPTIQFYANSQRMDTFPCGPSKVPILKRKLAQFINENVDSKTLQVKASPALAEAAGATQPAATMGGGAETIGTLSSRDPQELVLGQVVQQQKSKLRSIPFLMGMLESEFDSTILKANLLTFDDGNIIMRQGNPGRTFYFIVEGEVEICQKTSFEDPLTVPSTYLGTVINRFQKGEYFGERALITREPRAASIRAASKTVCLAFDRDDFPASCVLSGKSPAVEKGDAIDQMNDRYGVQLSEMAAMNDQQYREALKANQVRGSVNRPEEIDGVDNDREVVDEQVPAQGERLRTQKTGTLAGDAETIVPLLLRFRLIRLVTRCFDYIIANKVKFGEEGGSKRRMLLVNLLSIGQQAEIRDAYNLVDADNDGEITILELRTLMGSIGETRTDKEYEEFIETGHGGMAENDFEDDGKQVITYAEFMGLMAEVEFYHLFLETFRALDEFDSGFVRAEELDRVLCGLRDLVSDDRRSIIDVEDTDMMVDYEQFSRMMLGTALK